MRRNYVNGTWTPSVEGGGIDVVNPATTAVIDRVPAGHEADVDVAVQAARTAFGTWSIR
jgi:aldehyde dehydrogenase (NAD+)